MDKISNEKKEKMTAKQKIQNFGVKKFSILIIGLIMCLVGVLYVALHNAQGGLIEIEYKEYKEYYEKASDKKLVYIAGDDDNSREFLPIINAVLKDTGVQAYYLDMTKIITAGKETEFMGLTDATKESYMIPMVMVIENKKVVDTIQGYTDRDTLKKFIEKNKLA